MGKRNKSRIRATEFGSLVQWTMTAHNKQAREPKNRLRYNTMMPYGVHPCWCAFTLAHETVLPADIIRDGVYALFGHDVVEDTLEPIPPWFPDRAKEWIELMTFPGGTDQEHAELFDRPPVIRLLKAYDKYASYMDTVRQQPPDKRLSRIRHLMRLCNDVARNFPGTNIERMARAACEYELARA